MITKLKNDPGKYVTRAKLGGAGAVSTGSSGQAKDEVFHVAERFSKGTLDERWYVQLFPHKRAR